MKPEGFDRERVCVVPRPMVTAALARPVTGTLSVTHAGCFPEAPDHLVERPSGTPEAVLIACTRGSGWVSVDGDRFVLPASSYTLLPPDTAHAYGSGAGNSWTIWWLHLRGSGVAELQRLVGMEERPFATGLRGVTAAVALWDQIVRNLERGPTPARLVENSGLAWHLLTRLAVDYAEPGKGSPLDRAIRFLEDNIDRAVAVGELAALVGLSPSHLSAQFRRASGGGVTAYHQGLRMARARALLDTTDLTVTQIARAVGYDDPLYFSRQFRKAHALSPTQYRLSPHH